MNDTVEPAKESFFNRQFWRMTLIAAFSQLIVLVIAISAGLIIGSKMDQITTMFSTMNSTLERVETTINTVTGVDTDKLQEQAKGIAESTNIVGEGLGDGGATAIDKIGDAIKKW